MNSPEVSLALSDPRMFAVRLPAGPEQEMTYWREQVFSELLNGRARFGFSNFESSDLRNLQGKVGRTPWQRLPEADRETWSNTAFLLHIVPGDYLIYLDTPNVGEACVAQASAGYFFAGVWDMERRGDFRHLIDCRFLGTFSLHGQSVSRELKSRLLNVGSWERISLRGEFEAVLQRLRPTPVGKGPAQEETVNVPGQGTPASPVLAWIDACLSRGIAFRERDPGPAEGTWETEAIRTAVEIGYAAALQDVRDAFDGNTAAIGAVSEGTMDYDRFERLMSAARNRRASVRGEIRINEVVSAIRSGESNDVIMSRYGLSLGDINQILHQLAAVKAISPEEFLERLPVMPPEPAQGERRKKPRCYPILTLPVYDMEDPTIEGYVKDLSDGGIQVAGITARVGESRTFLIRGDEFADSGRFSFHAECRWFKAGESGSPDRAGFLITEISEEDLHELRRLLGSMSFCDLADSRIVDDFRSGMNQEELMGKYDLSQSGLRRIFRTLIPDG